MVFYRKYRPQKIADLDSEEIRERLYSVLRGSSISHAFLFTGPKGLGKTSAARILAKAVNCEKNSKIQVKSQKSGDEKTKQVQSFEELEPCDQCSQCISITNGNNLDVFEIDGASNRGIDEIRDIREKLRLSPQAGTLKKIYIIDEVHMLTAEAFNALLKTLEEPPEHVLFILCTTEPGRIPATIVSRCFHIRFKSATRDELVRSFERIVKGESIDIEKQALYYIADLSGGGFRDGAKILEEMTQTFQGKKITKQLIEEKYHLEDSAALSLSLIKAARDKDITESLKIISSIEGKGLDVKLIIQDALTVLHEALLFMAGVSDGKNDLKLDLSDLSDMAEVFTKAYSQVKYAVLPELPLEIAVIEYIGRRAASAPASQNSSNLTFLQDLINKTKTYNHSVSGLLRGCEVVSFDKDKLILGTKFKFHKDKLDDEKNKNFLEKAVKEISGKKVEILIELKNS